MRKYIKKIQEKDEIVRKQIFLGLMIFSMVAVSSIWIYSLDHRFNNKVKEQAKEDVKPFQRFANSVSNTYDNISASVGNSPIIKLENQEENNKKISQEKQINLIVVNKSASQ